MNKNLFIALEGIDGSGKSTQAKLLAEKLQAEGHKVHLTAEPTSGAIGKMIRDIFKGNTAADHRTIAALFLADRLEHITNEKDGLLKKLAEGYTIICDRYYFSSYAYHSVHMDMAWVIMANKICADLLRPTATIYVEMAPEESMKRLAAAGRQHIEIYETHDNLRNVRDKYLQAFALLKGEEKIIAINGNQPPQQVAAEVWQAVSGLL